MNYLQTFNKISIDYANKLYSVFGGDIMALNNAIGFLGSTPDYIKADNYLDERIAEARTEINPSRYLN